MKRIVFSLLALLLLFGGVSCAADSSNETDFQAALERAASGANLLPGYEW